MKKNKDRTGYKIDSIGLISPLEWIILNSLWYIFWGIIAGISGKHGIFVLQVISFIIAAIWIPFMIFTTSFYYKNRIPISNVLRKKKL